MSGNSNLTIKITTEDAQTLAAFKRLQKEAKQLGVTVDGAGKRAKSAGDEFKQWATGLAVGAGLLYAVDQAEEAEKAQASLEQTLKSMGKEVGVTADHVSDLAGELSKTAAVDDDLIVKNAAVLATFKNVVKEGPIYDQALASALDLSAALGTDLQSATIQVGKALNDPIKGMTALTRAGVSFTAQQKEQIKTLVASGDVIEAQKIILAELEAQFGGQAEAMATGSARARVAIDEMAESVGTSLAPAVEMGANALAGLASGFGSLPQPVQAGILAMGGMALVANKVADNFGDVQVNLKTTVSDVGKFNSAMAAGTAGLTAFGATLAYLENLSKSSADVSGLTSDLTALAEGAASADEALTEFGGAEKFAKQVEIATITGDNWADADFWTTSTVNVKNAKNDMKAFDEALAQMVESGNAEGAMQVLVQLRAAIEEQGGSFEDLMPWLDDYEKAMERDGRGAFDAASGASAHSSALGVEAGAIRDAALAAGEKAAALKEVNDETERSISLALGGFSSTQDYEAAVSGTQEAQQQLNDARASGDQDAIRRAEENLEGAMVRQAEAAGRVYEAQAELNGAQLTGGERAAVLRAEMEKARQTTGFWTGQLETLRTRLLEAEGTYKINIEVTKNDQTGGLLSSILGGSSSGPAQPYGTPGTMGPPSKPRALTGDGLPVPGLTDGTVTTGDGAAVPGGRSVVVQSTTNIGSVQVGGIRGVSELTTHLDRRDRAMGRRILIGTAW